jgi:hypothetical protein
MRPGMPLRWSLPAVKRKYRNKPQIIDGIRFDSIREAKRWQELLLLARVGKITQLERQVVYELAPKVKLLGDKRTRPAVRMVIDFRYWDKETGEMVLEDAKGDIDPVWRLKQHLLKTVHGLDVRKS